MQRWGIKAGEEEEGARSLKEWRTWAADDPLRYPCGGQPPHCTDCAPFLGWGNLAWHSENLRKLTTWTTCRDSELFLHDWVSWQLAIAASCFHGENGFKSFLKGFTEIFVDTCSWKPVFWWVKCKWIRITWVTFLLKHTRLQHEWKSGYVS